MGCEVGAAGVVMTETCEMEDGQCRNCGAIEIPSLAPECLQNAFVWFHNRLVRLLGGPVPCSGKTTHDVCSRCERPVIKDPETGAWQHAEVADAIFCDTVMRAAERVAARKDDDA